MERETKKRERSEADLNCDAFDLNSPDKIMRAISETALMYKEPVPLSESAFRLHFSNLYAFLFPFS